MTMPIAERERPHSAGGQPRAPPQPRAPLQPEQIAQIGALIDGMRRRYGEEKCERDQRYRDLLKLLKAHTHPHPNAEFTFAQLSALKLQILIFEHLKEQKPLPTKLVHAIQTGLTVGRPKKATPKAGEKRSDAPDQKSIFSDETKLMPRRADPTQVKPSALDSATLLRERESILEACADLYDPFDGEKPQIEMKTIDFVRLQTQLRKKLHLEHLEAEKEGRLGSRNRERAYRALQRDYERVDRTRAKLREQEEREKRTAKMDWLNSLIDHFNAFGKYHRDVVKRSLRQINKGVLKHHEDVARIADRAEREAEKKRIQKLREDDEEGYLELVKETKNARLMELLNQTDSYLKELGVKLKRERMDSGEAVDEDDNEDDGRKYVDIAHAREENITEQPALLEFGQLKEYQKQGLQWMVSLYNNRLNGILADEMGLGKTVQTIALICYLVEKKDNPGPYLIIVPLSTLENWRTEFERWAPKLRVVVFTGDKKHRRNLYENILRKLELNVCLCTFEYIILGKSSLRQIKWQYIIIDEGHRIKNHASKLSEVLAQQYSSRNRLLLTGTPLQNSLTELWALLNFLLPKVFHSCETFETWFSAPFESMPDSDDAPKALTEEERLLIIRRLHQVLRPFLLRRLKSEVLKMGEQLPTKQEDIIVCDMSAWQKYTHTRIVENKPLVYTNAHGRQCYGTLSNPGIQQRKISNHPYLFHEEHSASVEDGPELWRSSGKFDMLDGIILKLLRTNHRILVFNQMTRIVDLQERLLRYRRIPSLRLDGNTKPEDRSRLVKEFNRPDTTYHVFLLTTRAGGQGVNLQTADTVIIFDSDWNPQADKQAADRAHRIGQQREVRILRLITANSVETEVYAKATYKQGLEEKIIQAGMFDEKSKDADRQAYLRALLKEKEEAAEEDNAVPTIDEINQILARGDHELDVFRKVDRERHLEIGMIPRLMTEEELPDWLLNPDPDIIPQAKNEHFHQIEQDPLQMQQLAPRRAAASNNIVYNTDRLTDAQYIKLMENENAEDIADAIDRLKRKRDKGDAEGTIVDNVTGAKRPLSKKARKTVGGKPLMLTTRTESAASGTSSSSSSMGMEVAAGMKMLAPEEENNSSNLLAQSDGEVSSSQESSDEVLRGSRRRLSAQREDESSNTEVLEIEEYDDSGDQREQATKGLNASDGELDIDQELDDLPDGGVEEGEVEEGEVNEQDDDAEEEMVEEEEAVPESSPGASFENEDENEDENADENEDGEVAEESADNDFAGGDDNEDDPQNDADESSSNDEDDNDDLDYED